MVEGDSEISRLNVGSGVGPESSYKSKGGRLGLLFAVQKYYYSGNINSVALQLSSRAPKLQRVY